MKYLGNSFLGSKVLLRLPKSGLLAWGRPVADVVGVSSGPVQPGRGYTGDGVASIAIAGLLTTDVITADSTDVPTCTVDGTMDIANTDVVYGVTVTRSGEQIAYYSCAEGSGTFALNTFTGDDALPHGVISDDSIHTELIDGTGFDLNQEGFSVYPRVQGTVVFVSSVSGLDTNDGLSSAAPVKTIAKALTIAGDGDTILLKRGSVFREQFEIPDNSIVRPYGVGEMVVVSGAEILNNAQFSLTTDQTYTYEISLPSIPETYNPHADITNSDVLMTWEDGVRLGPRFTGAATSIATVEATSGSQWWDSSAKKLYIHPADDSNPVSNGKLYEASVRTLCLHGGDGFYVEGIHADACYAKTSLGQQGYQILGYKGGHYYKCKATRGWNHLVGCNNNQAFTGELLFENVLAEDAEEIPSLAATLFVFHKQPDTPYVVNIRAKNCVARQPNPYTTVQTYGFYTHGDHMNITWESVSAENCYIGLVPNGGSYETITATCTGVHTFIDCKFGVESFIVGETISGIRSKSTGVPMKAISSRAANQSFSDVWTANCALMEVVISGAGGTTSITDSYCAFESAPSGIYDNVAIFSAQETTRAQPVGVTFYNSGCPYYHEISNADDNIFYGNLRIALATIVPGGDYTTLSAWQAASGQDANSVQAGSAPSLPDGIWSITLPDILADQFDGTYAPAVTPSSDATGSTLDYPGRLKYTPEIISGTTMDDYVLKWPVCPDLLNADDGTLFTAGVANSVDMATFVDLAWMRAGSKGEVIYDADQDAAAITKIDKVIGN